MGGGRECCLPLLAVTDDVCNSVNRFSSAEWTFSQCYTCVLNAHQLQWQSLEQRRCMTRLTVSMNDGYRTAYTIVLSLSLGLPFRVELEARLH